MIVLMMLPICQDIRMYAVLVRHYMWQTVARLKMDFFMLIVMATVFRKPGVSERLLLISDQNSMASQHLPGMVLQDLMLHRKTTTKVYSERVTAQVLRQLFRRDQKIQTTGFH